MSCLLAELPDDMHRRLLSKNKAKVPEQKIGVTLEFLKENIHHGFLFFLYSLVARKIHLLFT
jgi:hypothetical protein